MELFHEIVSQGRRLTVDLLHSGDIERSTPYSPEVPEELRSWMPDLYDRFPVTPPWEKTRHIDPARDNVWILDNTAFQDRAGWKVEFIACFFIKNSGKDLSRVVAHVAENLGITEDDHDTRKRIAHRLEPFVDKVLPNRLVDISVDQKDEHTLGPSSQAGISSHIVNLNFQPTSSTVQSFASALPPPFTRASTTVLAKPQGWAIISDIDDTIKLTQTSNATGILAQTFTVEDPQPIVGMPELYSHIKTTLQDPAFFYLSASPYNLYPFLRKFRDHHYPQGTIILRDASWQNLGGLIASLTQGTEEYKADRIAKVHSWLPERKLICIGDSTQSDPEAYGDSARRFPGWIKAIFIRKVSGIAGMDVATKNAPERFEKAFRGLDKNLWHVFTEPGELAERIDALTETE